MSWDSRSPRNWQIRMLRWFTPALLDGMENCMQRSDLARWAILPMRLVIGYGFMEHGFAKLSRGPDGFASILQQMGVPLPHVATWLTIGTELVGGVALLLGAFVV